jgi:biopolymer transport protein ExbB/TolQ
MREFAKAGRLCRRAGTPTLSESLDFGRKQGCLRYGFCVLCKGAAGSGPAAGLGRIWMLKFAKAGRLCRRAGTPTLPESLDLGPKQGSLRYGFCVLCKGALGSGAAGGLGRIWMREFAKGGRLCRRPGTPNLAESLDLGRKQGCLRYGFCVLCNGALGSGAAGGLGWIWVREFAKAGRLCRRAGRPPFPGRYSRGSAARLVLSLGFDAAGIRERGDGGVGSGLTGGVGFSTVRPGMEGMNLTKVASGERMATVVTGLGRFWKQPQRSHAMIAGLVAGVLFVALLTLLLDGRAAVLVLDRYSHHLPYPFTIQNLMHLAFFVGLADLFVRWRTGAREERFLHEHFLPEDDQTVLQSEDLGPIRRRVAGQFDHEHGFLPSLINLAILQFQSSRSVEQAAGVMNQSLELLTHRVDMRYNMVRFIAWVVPTLGFIGTVFALGASLSAAGDPNTALDLKETAKTLGIGFDCTMVALVESAVLVFILHVVQEKEESAVNRAGDYTLRNLINRLYAGN